MPWTLYRYMLLDLLRVIGLTTAVLVTVITFGAILKPLARGGVDAIQIAKYLFLVIVPMLQFALPFAAGFGSTLSFYRLTTDNEIQAMAASGISYRRVLLPVAALGVVLTLFMVVLTQTIIPHFWAIIVQTVTADVTKIFQASVERGEAFAIEKKMQIYADYITVESPQEPDGPSKRLRLFKVAAAELDDDGRIVTDVTASTAIVDVYHRNNRTYLKMVMRDTVALNAETGHLVYSERIAPPQAISVPDVWQRTTKALSRRQLLHLKDHPDEFSDVISAKEQLAQAIQAIELRQAIDSQLGKSGQLELAAEDLGFAQPRRYFVWAERMLASGVFIAPSSKVIEVVMNEGPQPIVQFKGESVRLAPATSGVAGDSGGAVFDLVLGEHEVTDLLDQAGGTNQRANLVVPNLRVAGQADWQELASLPSAALLERASQFTVGSVNVPANLLHRVIDALYHEITGRILNRYAISVTALLLLLLGATMAMWHRHSLPLTTYVWAFLPAVLDLIVISAGEQLLRDGRMWGHVVMWSGNSLLVIILIVAFWKLSKN